MESTLNNGMCRCCASEGTFKDVKSTYHWMGEEEVYSDMLQECFDIALSRTEDGDDGGICEVCITQLRNAANFKKQVQHTEEQFKKRVLNKMFKSDIVKIEPSREEENESDDDRADFGPEFEVPIKTEAPEEPKRVAKKRAAKASTSRAKKAKTDVGETSTKRTTRWTKKHENPEDGVKLKKLNFSTFITIKPVTVKKKKAASNFPEKSKITELEWQLDNAKTILRCSNATPIRCYVGSRYACSYCIAKFQDPIDLKKHTLGKHSDPSLKPEFFNIRYLSKYIVYMDVTALYCKLCNDKIDNLKDLLQHLKNEHSELIHDDINNHIASFKFDSNELKCVECSEEFKDFSKLQYHMNIHIKNYKCEFCEAGFINRVMAIDHKKDVHNVVQAIKYRSDVQ